MRWLVGDIQGCVREFARLLAQIRFDPARDELWCLGDLINRGPESLATLRMWRDIGGRGVLGNHDVYALLTRSGRWPRKRDTLAELFAAPDADELLARLRALPILAHLPATTTDVWVVHGGLDPRWTELPEVAAVANAPPHDDAWLTSPTVNFATRVRCCTADGERSKFDRAPADCPPPHRPWDQFYRGSALVVHGHWAWRGHYRNPPGGPRTMGLDSGCVYGGALTAWCQEEDRVVQVAAARAY